MGSAPQAAFGAWAGRPPPVDGEGALQPQTVCHWAKPRDLRISSQREEGMWTGQRH